MKKLTKILYIEDEVDIATIAKIALDDIGGFTVEICHSGESALEIATVFQPDLVILDVMMPNMDGPETLTKLRKLPEFKSTPVIFMTAKAQQSEINDYISMGVLAVISKPFDPLKLADQVNDIWDNNG